jgi:hypothetical protein
MLAPTFDTAPATERDRGFGQRTGGETERAARNLTKTGSALSAFCLFICMCVWRLVARDRQSLIDPSAEPSGARSPPHFQPA